jgi:hypothetical protein
MKEYTLSIIEALEGAGIISQEIADYEISLSQKEDLTSILFRLLKLTHDRGHFEKQPLPGKSWDDCFDIQCGLAILHYHLPGDKSSKAVHIEL